MAENKSGNPFACFSNSDPDQARKCYQSLRSKLIFYFSHRRLHDPEDLADDVIARAWRRYTDGATIEELLQYCYGIAANVVRETQKKPSNEPLDAHAEAPDNQASREMLASENSILLEECLEALSAFEREVLLGYFNADRTAVAARLGITPNALRIRVSRSLDKIQGRLGQGEKARVPPDETK